MIILSQNWNSCTGKAVSSNEPAARCCLLSACWKVWTVPEFDMLHSSLCITCKSIFITVQNLCMPMSTCLPSGWWLVGPNMACLQKCTRLLHNPSLVVVGLSVEYETWPPIHRELVWLVGLNVNRGYQQLQWIYFAESCDWCKFMLFYKLERVPCTV